MAAPNIVNVTSILGKTAVANITTVATTILENESESGNVIKVNTLMVSNIDSSNIVAVDVNVVRSSASFCLIKSVSIPSTSSIDVLTKSLYLEEGDSIAMLADANTHSQTVISYEVIT